MNIFKEPSLSKGEILRVKILHFWFTIIGYCEVSRTYLYLSRDRFVITCARITLGISWESMFTIQHQFRQASSWRKIW